MDENICEYCGLDFDLTNYFQCPKSGHRPLNFPERVVAGIVKDFTDRRGVRQAWEEIDSDIQFEILDTWKAIVESET